MRFFETDRLFLRNITAKDADTMYDYRNNEICARYQRGQTKDYNGIVALVERRKNDVMSVDAPFMVAVALKDTDEMVGEIVVMPKDGTISLGYKDMGYIPTMTSQVFGKWTTPATEAEISQAVNRD